MNGRSRDVQLATVAVTCICIIVSSGVLTVRNLYEDELASFAFVMKSFSMLWRDANAFDVHPPGAYVVARLGYLITGSERYAALLPLLVWIFGVAVFVRTFQPVLSSAWGRILFALMAFLHPQCLMWSNTIRWYPIWWGGALLVLSFALSPRLGRGIGTTLGEEEGFSPGRCLTLLLGLVLLLYTNYLTLAFIPCFLGAFFLRFGFTRAIVLRMAVVVVLSLLAGLPQIYTLFNVHVNGMPQGGAAFRAAARLTYGMTIGEAVLPWHPLAFLAGFLVIAPGSLGAARYLLQKALSVGRRGKEERAVLALSFFLVLFLVVAVLSGAGFKSRSFLGLVPVFGLIVCVGLEQTSSKRDFIRRVRLVWACAVLLWTGAGVHNLLMRQGTAKGGMNDHPEEVFHRIVEITKGAPTVVFAYDPVVAYVFNRLARVKKIPLSVCCTTIDHVHGVNRGSLPHGKVAYLVTVETFKGAWLPVVAELDRVVDALKGVMCDSVRFAMGTDELLRAKRYVLRRNLVADRYIVTVGSLQEGAELSALARIWGEVEAKLGKALKSSQGAQLYLQGTGG